MTAAELNKHLDRRAGQAARFILAPHYFQLCDQCNSICRRSCPKCPWCGAYRFIFDVAEITRVAILLGNKPFPSTGVVPRL